MFQVDHKQGNQSSNMETFQVNRMSKYSYPMTELKNRRLLGSFSTDANRTFWDDQRSLSFIKVDLENKKLVDYDLTVASNLHVRKLNHEDPCNEKLDRMLIWILKHREKLQTVQVKGKQSKCLSTDFVTFRGTLTRLMKTPYERREGWILCATKYKGTIYMCEFQTPENVEREKNETREQKAYSCWGHKFEQYMTEGSDVKKGKNENEEFRCVVHSQLGTHSLLYGAEMDGADPTRYKRNPLDLDAFVELKTNKLLQTARHEWNFGNYKLRHCWCQSYLAGVPRVIFGFRDEKGVVKKLQCISVKDMPALAPPLYSGGISWEPNEMLSFIDHFLTSVKKRVVLDDPKVVYKFERAHSCTYEWEITCTYEGSNSKWSFLPEWYYNEVFRTPSTVPMNIVSSFEIGNA